MIPPRLLAPRQWTKGPQGVPVNRTAEQARVMAAATSPTWALDVVGPEPYRLTLADLEPRAVHEARLPVNCVEGWSVGADWRGLSLLEVVLRAGGTADSRIQLISLEQDWGFYTWDERTGEVRWMCAHDTRPEDVDAFAAAIRDAARKKGV